MLINQLDEPALELILSFLRGSSEGLKGLYSFHLTFPSLAHLIEKQFLKIEIYPPEGLKYKFRTYKRNCNGEKIKLHTYDWQIDMLTEMKNLQELSLPHPIRDLHYSHGYDIGRNCPKLAKVVGLHNSIEFVSGIVDGLRSRVALDEIELNEITVKSIQTKEEYELHCEVARSLPRLKTFTVLLLMMKDHKVI